MSQDIESVRRKASADAQTEAKALTEKSERSVWQSY